MAAASEQTQRSARDVLVGWANQQGDWIRTIVREVVASRGPLTSERVSEIYQQFLIEKELASGDVIRVPVLALASGIVDGADVLALTQMDSVENVNALTTGQTIVFNPALTVVFGRNGSGKSGYVRVLKRAARVRSAEVVLPNVTSGKQAAAPRARISYRQGATDGHAEWKGEEGLVPLTRLDVFDARATALHVDDDLTYVYTPSDLALFRYVHDAMESIRSQLESATKASNPSGNPFLSRFSRESSVYPKIEALGAATDVAELERLAAVSPTEVDGIDGLREQVAALRPEASGNRIVQLDADLRLLQAVLAACTTLNAFDVAGYHDARRKLASAEERYRSATDGAFSGDLVPGALGEPWRAFVVAADAYRASLGNGEYPATGDKCLYCRQDLSGSALELVAKYKDYCNSKLKQDVDGCRAALEGSRREVAKLDLAALITDLTRRQQLADGPAAVWIVRAAALVSAALDLPQRVRAGTEVEDAAWRALLAETLELLRAQQTEASSTIAAMQGQATERAKAHEAASKRLRELEARIVLRDLLSEIREHVERAKWAYKAKAFGDKFRKALKSLTDAAKEASETLLNQDFERLFRAECTALRAPGVRLDFPGRKGQPARRKLVATDYRLSDVLSEGEQKVIALADFLAEVQLKPAATPVVFDDPVNSLDYERMGEVVDRIARLCNKRQVIVFTHNIWFAVELLNRFEKAKEQVSYFDIAQDNGKCGIVTGGTSPRTDSVSSIAKRINTTVHEAKKLSGETQAALIEKGYEHVRAWCEVVVERELLQEVVQRYQPNVKMGALGKIKAQALVPAINAINPTFEKACRYIAGHSQPLETLNVRPTLAELEKDWADLQAARTAYLGATA